MAHKINHNIGLRPLGLAIMAPATPAITIKMAYLIMRILLNRANLTLHYLRQ